MLLMLAEQEGRWPEAMLLHGHIARMRGLRVPDRSAASSANGSDTRSVLMPQPHITQAPARYLASLGCAELAAALLRASHHPEQGWHTELSGSCARPHPSTEQQPTQLGSDAEAAVSTLAQWTSIQVASAHSCDKCSSLSGYSVFQD
jgi:hypothetical protein